MEGCLTEEIASFNLLSHSRVHLLLHSESRSFELTKSILNLLFNIVTVQSVEPSVTQKKILEAKEDLVWSLLQPTITITRKKRLLEENIDLVVAVAESCPL